MPLDPAPRDRRRVRRIAAMAAAVFLLLPGLYFAIGRPYRARRRATVQGAAQRHAASGNAVNLPATSKASGRPVYAYSVIPGGAYSSAELAQAMDSNPLVARHYRKFDRSKLMTTYSHLAGPVYVSYRVGNLIYWTSKPVRLAAGELLLTDGTHFARARCGNRIELSVQSPVAVAEPLPGVLDSPGLVPGEPPLPAEEFASIFPGDQSESGPAAPVVAASVHGAFESRQGGTSTGDGSVTISNPPGGGGHPPEVVPVPEPSFLFPSVLGFAVVTAIESYRRRRAARD